MDLEPIPFKGEGHENCRIFNFQYSRSLLGGTPKPPMRPTGIDNAKEQAGFDFI